jgi:predicted permease
VLGAISLYQATLAYSRPINRVWGFAAAIMYDNSNSVTHQYFTQYWNAAQGTIDFSRKFGESWNGSVYLLFINQTQNFYGTPGTTNTAGLGLTLRYVWGHLLGR